MTLDATAATCRKHPANSQVWITTGDIILLSLREFQDDKADVIHRYTPDEARNLKTYGELKSDFTINEAADGDAGSSDEEGGIEFEEAEIDDLCESSRRWLSGRRGCKANEGELTNREFSDIPVASGPHHIIRTLCREAYVSICGDRPHMEVAIDSRIAKPSPQNLDLTATIAIVGQCSF